MLKSDFMSNEEKEYYKDKTMDELKTELFYNNPELFNEIAKERKQGMPKKYKKYVEKFDVNEKLFFFESNLAKQYTGNPRYIYERMLERYPDYKFVWAYNGDKDNIPGDAVVAKRKSKKYYKNLARARVAINNTVFPVWFLRKETFYLQTWHGTPYKLLHWDRESTGRFTSPDFYSKSTRWDCLLSPNNYSTSRFKSAFKYKGEILESGYPANDIFYDKARYEAKRSHIRKLLNIDEDSTVYLYAPTWRDGGHLGGQMFKFDLYLDPVEFMNHAPENSVLLIRTHHMSEEGDELKDLNENVIDVSGWDDAIELMCASDILINDYSSIVFDWYCSKKPVIYYVPDLEAYETTLRGTYFDIRKTNCGVLCKSEEELYDNLDVQNPKFHEEFYNEFCSLHTGHSADQVIDYIFDKTKKDTSIIKRIFRKIKK